MNNSMYKRYADKTPVAVHNIAAFAGIALFEPDEIDKYNGAEIVSALYNGEKYTNFHKHEIKYSPSGRAYIYKTGGKMFLDTFMRTNF